jgi:hypothetical protein
MVWDARAHEAHRLTPATLSKKLDTVRRVGGTVLYLHERDLDDHTVADVFGNPALQPLPKVTFLQLQSSPRLTSAALSVISAVAQTILPCLEEINVSYTAVEDLAPLAAISSLRSIDAIVEQPRGVAALAALPRLKTVTLSTAVTAADLEVLKRKKGCRVGLLKYTAMPPRFSPSLYFCDLP